LQLVVNAIFDSWDNSRASKYCIINDITCFKGTTINVQAMVFGNMGGNFGIEVFFTRNLSIGEKKLYGEYFIKAHVCHKLGLHSFGL
jgi:pyruvate,orthophosphate dikinase